MLRIQPAIEIFEMVYSSSQPPMDDVAQTDVVQRLSSSSARFKDFITVTTGLGK